MTSRRAATAALALSAALTLAGCGEDDPLADDEQGRAACSTQADLIRDYPDASDGAEIVARVAAAQSKSRKIRASVSGIDPDSDTPIMEQALLAELDQDVLADACEELGVDMPD